MTDDSRKKQNLDEQATSEQVVHIKEELEEKVRLLSQTNRQLKRKIFDLYTIFEISRNFNAVLEYQTLLDTFVFTCLGQVGALKGAIFLKEELRAETYNMAKSKGSGNLPGPEAYLSENSSLVQYLARLNRPVRIDDLTRDIVPVEEAAILKCFESGVVVPLVFQNRMVGLFLLAEKLSGRDFSVDDIEFLSVLGNQIAVAIENARLYEAERAAIDQLQAAQHQIVQAERLAALGEMSAKIAHEVNNPLGIIKNYVNLCGRKGQSREDIVSYTGIVSEEIDRIANIVAQMREFQRPARAEHRPINLEAVLDSTLKLTERQLSSSNITLHREIPHGPHIVKGFSDGLRQVFLNLIINARAEMQSGGELTVELIRENGEVVISFTDTGPGIPAEIIPRIFEPFFTTKGEHGTGLGLSVCYGIIKSHNGSITFKNVDSGGRFEIRLPLLAQDELNDTEK